MNRHRFQILWLPLAGVLILAACSRSGSADKATSTSPNTGPAGEPTISQEDAEKLVAERFQVDRYIKNDFIPKPGARAPTPVSPKKTLKIGLYWVMNDELTPWYVARDKGFFAQQGIDIEMTEGGPGRDMLTSLIAGRLDVYIGPVENALYVINSRTGTDLKMVGALLKDTPAGYIGLDTSVPRDQPSTRHLTKEDLIGKRIAASPGSAGEIIIDILCSDLNIDSSQLHITPAGATPDGLISGAVDYYQGFETNQPRVLERNGYKNWTFFPFSDLGLRDYFDASVVSNALYQQQPQVLANYIYALNEGIQYEMAHPDEAADIAVRDTSEYPVTREEVLKRMKTDFQLYRGDGSEPILAMNSAVVIRQLALLYRYHQIELPAAPATAGQ